MARHLRIRIVIASFISMLLFVPPMTSCGTDSSTSTHADSVTVRIIDGKFDPRIVEVDPGTTVTWTNDDVTDHLVTSLEPGIFTSPYLQPGSSYSFQFPAPGSFRYYDDIRNTLKGEVIVR